MLSLFDSLLAHVAWDEDSDPSNPGWLVRADGIRGDDPMDAAELAAELAALCHHDALGMEVAQ